MKDNKAGGQRRTKPMNGIAYKTACLTLYILVLLAIPANVCGFWVVNFGTARTLHKGKVGFAAGMGGQMVFLGYPK